MNLDQQINVLTDMALKEKTLDVVSEGLLKYGDIYSDIIEEKTKINADSVLNAFNPNLLAAGQIVDINELMQYDDYDFVENVYIKILGRPSDRNGLLTYLQVLRDGKMNKMEILQGIAFSEEAKIKGTLLTGYKVLDISEFLRYHELEFVDMSYVLILGRHADSGNLENYLNLLMTGEISKEEILFALKNSEEGANRELEIVGLDALYKKRLKKKRIFQIPIVGKCARWIRGVRHVNRKINELTVRGYSTEKRLQECLHQNHGDSNRIARLEQQVAATIEQLEQINRRTAEISVETNESIDAVREQTDAALERVASTQGHLDELRAFTNQVGSNVNDINGILEKLGLNVHDINEALGNYDKILGEYAREDKKIIRTLLAEVCTLKARLNELEKNGVTAAVQVQSEVSVPKASGDDYTSIDYFDFENHFRGSREHVKKVQTMYLPYFEGKKKVLDLGCGRGEFTEMLVEQNVGVTGVDQYAPYVEYMKMLGLPVVLDDAIHYLREQEQVDGIFVGQVVEHISIGQIMELCKLAYEKLEEGCYFIMETPNPTSLAIYTECFYMDPSHQKPVHPQTLKYVAEKSGFSSVEILYTRASRMPFQIPRLKENDEDFREFNEAMGRVSDLLYGSQDYAIIARR